MHLTRESSIRTHHGTATERPLIDHARTANRSGSGRHDGRINAVVAPETLADAGVSEREAEVLDLVAERATNAEIAARLFVSVRTVESHVSSLLRKLGVSDRRALADLAGRAPRPGADGIFSGPATGSARPLRAPTRVLPVPLTSFVGRAAEVAALAAAVDAHRLVTATGPGGVGKTRLATAVAAELSASRPDGVWFVDLVPVSDPALVPSAVSAVLGLDDPRGRTVEEALLSHLRDREALLVLDNCEHLAEGAAVFVERLLGRCPRVHVLATSQARLLLPFEWVFPVPCLSLPTGEGGGEGDDGDAVALFVERARQSGLREPSASDRRRIGEICRRLDGVALAIELAAARMASLGLDGIEEGLSERLRLLTGGSRVDERHQSLRSAIDWSYALLDPADQALLRRIGVFHAQFTADAAAAVAGFGPVEPGAITDCLARLAEHSLLVTSPGDLTSYRALETIRQYGTEVMAAEPPPVTSPAAASELDAVRRRHLAWATEAIVALDRRSDITLAEALATVDTLRGWRADFDRVADDARAALCWAHEVPELRSEAAALATALGSACFTRGLLGECLRRYEQAADLADDEATVIDRLMEAAGAATSRHVGVEALRLWRVAADAAIASGHDAQAAFALARAAELLNRGTGILAEQPPAGTVDALLAEARPLAGGDPRAETAITTAQAFDLPHTDPQTLALAQGAVASAREIGDPLLESGALDALSAVHLANGDVPAAVAAVTNRLDLLSRVRPAPHNGMEISDGFSMASEIALAAGDFAAARRYADTLVKLPFYSEEGHLAASRRMKVDALAGDLTRVLADAEKFRASWERAGRPVAGNLSGGAYAVAMVHGLRGDDEARADWRDLVIALGGEPDRLDGCGSGYAPTFDAVVSLHRGEPDAAMDRLEDDPASFATWHAGEWRTWYAALYAEATVLAGDSRARDRIAHVRPIAEANPTVALLVDRAEALADGDRDRLVALADRLADTGCRYQWARTLVLAGGEAAERGRAEMAALGAAPMAEQTA